MHSVILRRGAAIATAAVAVTILSGHVMAQPPHARLTGLIHDYTPALDASGPWQVVGNWTLAVNAASGKGDFAASLSMVRSENANRQHHTHHVQLDDAEVTALGEGYHISGTGTFTSNGSLAAFTGSPVDIDVTGGSAAPYATIVITFGGAATAHFGTQLKGVVTLRR
jgi:hypothetical protein